MSSSEQTRQATRGWGSGWELRDGLIYTTTFLGMGIILLTCLLFGLSAEASGVMASGVGRFYGLLHIIHLVLVIACWKWAVEGPFRFSLKTMLLVLLWIGGGLALIVGNTPNILKAAGGVGFVLGGQFFLFSILINPRYETDARNEPE